ncbi:MAG: universal stress protein [Pyrinomonadaceae bacterium]|nr:universal stress protein [Pyrinomonadaceae bacterium]MCX7640967.1 universal stress protein [Pyrinomonadaceae bacterium]MDW8305110.1 universal stress protein [Acidobacteriota bacterium]
MKVEDVLVAVDFSPNSIRAIEFAVSLVEDEAEVYLLHVVDSDFIERVSYEGFSDLESAVLRMKENAEAKLKELAERFSSEGPKLETMVVVGKPFAEILRVANDLDFQFIVMGVHGRRGRDVEELLFGSTAEKVVRASRIPVICVPDVR